MQADDNNNKKPPQERPDLDRRYGRIGISAVAAALHFPCDSKNPAYAPVACREQADAVA